MSRRRPVSSRALWQVLVAVSAIVLVMGGITWLHRSGPTANRAPLPAIVEGVPDVELVTCERTLPESDEQDPDFIVGPVGRITSAAAVACPRRFDGRLVTYVGEVVGDVLRRAEGAWVQVNDDGYALDLGPLPGHREYAGTNSGLAVWLPEELVEVVEEPGRRGRRGDIIVVEGVFHRTDPADGGGLTIRAASARLVAAATTIDQPFHRAQALAAGIAALVAIALSIAERRVRRRR